MSDVGRNFPKCHLMSEIFPPSIDSTEADETAGEEKHKTREIIQLSGLSSRRRGWRGEVQHVGLKLHTRETQAGGSDPGQEAEAGREADWSEVAKSQNHF